MTMPSLLAFSLGGPEALIILALILLLFGAKKLPGLARSIGRSSGEFKKGKEESEIAEKSLGGDEEVEEDDEDESA